MWYMQVFGLCSIVICPLVMAINIMSTNHKDAIEPVTWDGYLSMANTQKGSIYMGVIVFFAYVITLFALWRLVKHRPLYKIKIK